MINNRIYKGLGHPSKTGQMSFIWLTLRKNTADRIIAESTGTSTCASYKRLCIHQRASQVKNALW